MICLLRFFGSGTRKGKKMREEYAAGRIDDALEMNESRAGYRSDGDDFVFEIKETLGILRKRNTGWTRELNIVAWNGGTPRFDIREWDPDHLKMTKGISFTKEEASQICKWLSLRGCELEPASKARKKGTAGPRAPKEEQEAQPEEECGDGALPF